MIAFALFTARMTVVREQSQIVAICVVVFPLRCGEPCDVHAEKRAGNIVKTDGMTEFDRRRVAAVFAADTAVKGGPCLFAELYCHLHELTYALGIELGERVELVDLCRVVRRQELTCVVTREAEDHLGEVVGAETEGIRFICNIVSNNAEQRVLITVPSSLLEPIPTPFMIVLIYISCILDRLLPNDGNGDSTCN